ncbi:hypothetical protein D3C85_1576660 [compost metagenome]
MQNRPKGGNYGKMPALWQVFQLHQAYKARKPAVSQAFLISLAYESTRLTNIVTEMTLLTNLNGEGEVTVYESLPS